MIDFLGYKRVDSSVGIRNHLLVIAPIDCSFEPAKQIADHVEGATAITQHYGCGANPMVINTLVGVARNPNVAGVLLLGLGCESLTCDLLQKKIEESGKPVESILIQKEGGTINAMKKGIRILKQMFRYVKSLKREPFPLSKLIVAIECGGSDTTSGLAANPSLGNAVDKIIDEGGTVIFSETAEMIGTQHILAKRAINIKVSNDIIKMINAEEERLLAKAEIKSRFLTKGNVNGGITTIEEKSLGAICKSGSKPIQGVLWNDWSRLDVPTTSGLWVQDGTGWDVPSLSHMAAAGAQIACFTSGKGSTTGHAIVPVIKITGNPTTYNKLIDNIDVNAGGILNGSSSLNEVSKYIFDMILETASGKKLTKAEALGFKDFVVFSRNRTAEKLMGNC